MKDKGTIEIVYIEDSKPDIFMFERAAKQYPKPIALTVVTDGNGAMDFIHREKQFAQQRPPAFILLDLNIPFVHGFDVLTAIRMSCILKYTPVIVVTSSRDEDDLRKSYELGANAYVIKSNMFYAFQKSVVNLLTFWVDTAEVPNP